MALAKFPLPRLCLSCIPTWMRKNKQKKEEEELAVVEATVARAPVEISLSWGWAKVDQKICISKLLLNRTDFQDFPEFK